MREPVVNCFNKITNKNSIKSHFKSRHLKFLKSPWVIRQILLKLKPYDLEQNTIKINFGCILHIFQKLLHLEFCQKVVEIAYRQLQARFFQHWRKNIFDDKIFSDEPLIFTSGLYRCNQSYISNETLQQKLFLFFKIKEADIPEYLFNMIPQNNHQYHTRSNSDVTIFYCRQMYSNIFISHIPAWNMHNLIKMNMQSWYANKKITVFFVF